MVKLLKTRSAKLGQPPGSLVTVGDQEVKSARVSVIDYDASNLAERTLDDLTECCRYKDSPTVTWINVDSVSDAQAVHNLGQQFALHPLVVEDILNTDQRPRLEDFGQYIYIALKMLRLDPQDKSLLVEQVSLVLGPGFVLSFQELEGDVFELIRQRIRTAKGRIRQMGADYLAYCLIDAIVDGYFVILERDSDQIELLEEELMSHPGSKVLQSIHKLKRESLFLRKAVWPLREVINSFQRAESKLISDQISLYLRDVFDHTIQVIDTTETLRDMLAGMVEIYLSSLSNRMNEVMKVLTIIATIFIPLTFIAGLYGMNFQHMPELKWYWGYPLVLAVMLVVALGMLTYFRRKKWL